MRRSVVMSIAVSLPRSPCPRVAGNRRAHRGARRAEVTTATLIERVARGERVGVRGAVPPLRPRRCSGSRCAASATAAAPRTRCRRCSPPSGGRPRATTAQRGPGGAVALHDRAQRDRRCPAPRAAQPTVADPPERVVHERPRPTRRPRRRGTPGASTGRSRRCPRHERP